MRRLTAILALIFILILILKGKDFGPMHKAESEARKQDFTDKIDPHSKGSVSILEELKPQKGVVPRAYNAIVPVAVVIFGTIAGLLYSGYNEMVGEIYTALLRALVYRKFTNNYGGFNEYSDPLFEWFNC